MKFTFRADPLHRYLRGTSSFEVNFIGWSDPCQKYLWGRLVDLVKFTFRDDPLQNAFRGRLPREVERLCVHLRARPLPQVPERHIGF